LILLILKKKPTMEPSGTNNPLLTENVDDPQRTMKIEAY
jgi:hypothetical protein